MPEAVANATSTSSDQGLAQSDPKQPSNVPGGDGGGAVTSGTIKEAAAEAARKLKIGDEEVPEDEVFKIYKERKGHQQAANKILQEGKAAKKQADQFISMMKDKGRLFEAIQRLGHNPRQLAEEYLAGQLEEEMLDPREKELREYKFKLQKYQEMEEEQKRAGEERRDNELKKKFADDYTRQFTDALKESGLPATKAAVAEMAKYIHRAAKMQFQMTAQEAAQLVKEDIERAHQNLYGEADAETLVKLLGHQGLQKIRTYDTSRLKDPESNLHRPEQQGELRERSRTSNRRMTASEWRRHKIGK